MGKQLGWLAVVGCLLISPATAAETRPTQENEHVVIDDVKIPYGATVTIEGHAYNVSDYRFDFVPAGLLALRINGKATQCELHVQLISSEDPKRPKYDELKRIAKGSCYSVKGQLRNARFSGTRNVCVVEVESFKEIPDITLKCEDFVDREVTFEGLAQASSQLARAGELIAIDEMREWPDNVAGKEVSVSGKLRRTDSGWRLEQAQWSLLKLEDQVGQTVSLTGHLWSLNGHWWFDYRGQRLYLIIPAGPVASFPSDDHGRLVRVTGLLLNQLRPALNQISLKQDRDLISCFVVRLAKVEFQDQRTKWSGRFGAVNYEANKVEDGVPVLIPKPSLHLNSFGNETGARSFIERNHNAIDTILGGITDESLRVLASRMNDGKTDNVLRLIYAAILARVNDDRGRHYLLQNSQLKDGVLDLNALYCLTVVPFLGSLDLKNNVSMEWAEPSLISFLNDFKRVKTTGGNDREKQQTISDAALHYTSIVSVLANLGSRTARDALLAHALANHQHASQIVGAICRAKTPPTVAELLQLERNTEESSGRRQLLSALLRAKATTGLDRFLPDLESGFVYMDVRSQLTPEVLPQLQSMAQRAKGKQKAQLEMLLILAEKDPIPRLIACLNDSKWIDKNLVLFEMARLKDPRPVRVVGKILREAPATYFRENRDPAFEATVAINHGLDAIASTGTADAIQELILLLKVDLARFGSYIDRAGLQTIVATHLIELTGESFGVDAEAWQKWRDAHPDHAVKRDQSGAGPMFRVNSEGVIDFGQ